MLDLRGVMRKYCTTCGKDECEEFLKVEQTPFCGYCGCPATKHKKECIEEGITQQEHLRTQVPSPACNSQNTTVNSSEIGSTMTMHDDTTQNAIRNLNISEDDRILYLPNFSPPVRDSLIKGTIRQKKLWYSFITQCALHYKCCDTLKTKAAYDYIGQKMYETYPSISGLGSKPWSNYTKCLSQKVRQFRMKDKLFHGFKVKKEPQESIIESESSESTMEKEFSESTMQEEIENTKETYFRSVVKISSASDEEIPKIKDVLKREIEKDWPNRELIKSKLKVTFQNRTQLLRKGECVISEYPCLKESEYILFEFSILIGGGQNLITTRERMKDFFENLPDSKSHKYSKEPALGKWLSFEKKVNKKQCKRKQFSEILKTTEDKSEYNKNLKEVENPCAWLLIEDGCISEASVLYQKHIIEIKAAYVPYILTVLFAVYYCFELHYPKVYLQAMGTLGKYVLGDQLYKLGKSAQKVLKILYSDGTRE